MRLLVKEILVFNDAIVIRHSIPAPTGSLADGGPTSPPPPEVAVRRSAPQVTFCVRGVVFSPTIANAYLQYAYDLWVHRWRQTKATGDMIVAGFADDTIVGFEHEQEAKAFLQDLARKNALVRIGVAPGQDSTNPLRSPRGQAAGLCAAAMCPMVVRRTE